MTDFCVRLLGGFLVNCGFAVAAYRVGSVRMSGVLVGVLLGTIITVCLGFGGLGILAGFFVVGSLLTRLGYGKKMAMGAAEARGGARGASHALANAGFPTLFAVLALVTQNPIWVVAFVAGFATAAMDTAGSELGPLYGKKTFSLKNGALVPPGTEGAVSLEGTLGGLAAAAILGLLGFATGLLTEPLQLLWVMMGALLGNLYEGLVGARRGLPHAWLNATNTLVGGTLGALGAILLG